jgi:protein-S-isoprenylcysteine O-methyltransferase Ste14
MENKQEMLKVPVKPPLIYLLSIAAGLLLQLIFPIKFFPVVTVVIGLVLIAVALVLFVWTIRLFGAADTAVTLDIPPTALVTTGIYQYSRNPMYLAFTLLQLGFGLALNNIWLLLTLIPTLIIMTTQIIRREEAFLAAEFGQLYLDYKAAVRRWL